MPSDPKSELETDKSSFSRRPFCQKAPIRIHRRSGFDGSLWFMTCFIAMMAPPAAARPAGLEATIVRTSFGIPHITANSWKGLGYGVGYSYAQDNLCVIANEFVTLRGERSLYFGPNGTQTLGFKEIDNLASDVYLRATLDVPRLRRGERSQGHEVMQIMRGYVAGYNRLLRDLGPERIPEDCRGKPWVLPITIDDMLRLNEKQMLISGSLGHAASVASASPPSAQPKKTALDMPQREDISFGSNGWAFGAETTQDGRGLLIGNPHFPWSGPLRFWQMHVTLPGKLDVMGVGTGGAILPTIGFNRDVAWTHTVTAARHFTVYQLQLDPQNPTTYLIDGKSNRMVVKTISVPMPNGAAPLVRKLYVSRFGPIITNRSLGLDWSSHTAFAIKDGNLGNQRNLKTWLQMARAHNVNEIRLALETNLGVPWVNTIAADRQGNVLHADVTVVPNLTAERISACATPISSSLVTRMTVLDGSRSACKWIVAAGTPVRGLMPASDQAVYSRRDYVTNSNDGYWMSNASVPHVRLSPILGPYGTELTMRTRSNFVEIDRLLNGSPTTTAAKINQTTARSMTFANHSYVAELIMDDLLTLCRGDQRVTRGCAALSKWDRRFDLDSRGAYLFATFWNKAKSIPNLWAVKFDPAHPISTPRGLETGGAVGTALVNALAEAVADLDDRKIDLAARWGEVQFVRQGSVQIPIHGGPGAAGVLNVQEAVPMQGGITPVHGSSYVQVVGFDDQGPVADAVLSYSQSTDPASPYFSDQTRLYSGKGWHRLPFTPEQIAADGGTHSVKIAE